MAERMRAPLGQPVIVENVVGAIGTIGAGRVARAVPDGYTLSMGGFNSHVVSSAVYTLGYDVLRDFEPVALLSSSGGGLIVARKSMPANDLKGLIAWLKANPDMASAGNPGAGSSVQLSAILFQSITGTRFQHVPYRGGGPAMLDLVAGQIDMMIAADVTTSVPQVRAATIKAYAVAAKSRLAAVPDVPTVDEAGLPGFYSSPWCAFWVPRGTPKPVVAKLNAAVMDALADASVRARLADLGQEIYPASSKHPKRSGHRKGPISRSGGRSSRRRASRRSEVTESGRPPSIFLKVLFRESPAYVGVGSIASVQLSSERVRFTTMNGHVQ